MIFFWIMQTFRQIQACQGYYYDSQTGDILRNVGPDSLSCRPEEAWTKPDLSQWDEPRFDLLTCDISAPFSEVKQCAESRFPSRVSGTIVNRQTARQADEHLVTQEARTHFRSMLGGPTKPNSPGEAEEELHS